MERIKQFIGIRLKDGSALIKTVLIECIYFTVGFLFGGISFSGGLSPFASGYCSSVAEKHLPLSAIGSAVGYAVFFGFSKSLRFIAAICLITFIRLGVGNRIPSRFRMIFSAVLALFSTFASSISVFAATGGDNTMPMLFLCESAISGAFSCFGMRVEKIAALKKKGAFFAPSDTAATIFFGCILLLSLERFSVFGFSFARIVAFYIIMLFALCGKEAASCITGVCTALTLGIGSQQPHLMLCCTLSGLLTGLTGVYGKLPVCLSLIFSSVLSLILQGEPDTAVISITETVITAVLFFITPEKLLFTVSKAVSPLSRDTFDEEKGRNVHFTLIRSAKAVKDISHSVNAVSNLLRHNAKPESNKLFLSVKDDICKECTKYDFCWNKCRKITTDTFEKANALLEKKGRLLSEDLPDRLTLICRMPDKITDGFNAAMCKYESMLVARNEIFDTKQAAVMQFSCLAGLLDDAAQKVLEVPKTDTALAGVLTPLFSEKGFGILGINAFLSEKNKSILQVYCDKVPVIHDMSNLLDEIYDITGISYEKPVSDEYSENGTVLSFYEESNYKVLYATSSHTDEGESFSGDTVECFYDGMGNFYAVLSDGMGTGTYAAVDSVMTCSLMSRLLKAGFSVSRSFETVNCALLVKSADESLSTLDIFSLNLDSAQASFYKAGAESSVIYKDKRTVIVEKSSLPLGILKESVFEKSEITLCDGDTVILMSDGAGVIPKLTIKDILNRHTREDVKTLSSILVNTALEMSVSGKHDDITVTCIRILKNEK